MDRRKSLKAIVAGTVTSGFMLSGCISSDTEKEAENEALAANAGEEGSGYGRTPEEAAYDEEVKSKTFFNAHEMATIAILADIIIPADDKSGSATEAGVPDFIEFIVKDMPYHKTPIRGGLMWLDHESNKRFNLVFKDASKEQQLAIVDDIAYPKEVKPEFIAGERFFSRFRNLVATGFFTSKMGIDDLGYVGNTPNVWDGVPQEVLDKHGLAYDEKTLRECVKPEERNEIANWDGYEV